MTYLRKLYVYRYAALVRRLAAEMVTKTVTIFLAAAVRGRWHHGCDPGGHYVGRLVLQQDGRYRWHGR